MIKSLAVAFGLALTALAAAALGLAPGSATAQTQPVLGAVTTAAPTYTTGSTRPLSLDTTGALRVSPSALPANQSVVIAPTSTAAAGITPVVSASAEASHVLKASAGNLYSVVATNLTATAGFLVVLNAASAPADGAITPLACVPLPAAGSAAINFNSGPPSVYATGITAVLTSAVTCFTKTTGTITGFISGAVQ